jgi:chemotaxis protein methyltransferase CheR
VRAAAHIAQAGDLALAGDEFDALARRVRATTGVTLSRAKAQMLCTRLAPRVRALALPGFAAYDELLSGPAGALELDRFIALVTTHKTDFFREAHHFALLRRHVLEPAQRERARPVRLWSAACSTGEEAYTMAMVVDEVFGEGSGAQVLATDIDEACLAVGRRGVYVAEGVADVSPARRERYFVEGTGDKRGLTRVRRRLRGLVQFQRCNLVEGTGLPDLVDAALLRNVLIYFDSRTQLEVVARVARTVKPGGLLCLGHSESMIGLKAGLRALGQGAFAVAEKAGR